MHIRSFAIAYLVWTDQATKTIVEKDGTMRPKDWFNTPIGDAGAEALAAMLPSFPTVKELRLYENEIGDTGAEKLAAALPSMTQLTELDLEDNNITSAGKEKLLSAAECLPNLTIAWR